MNWADLRLRLRGVVFRNRMEQELRREVDFHLDMMVRKNVARGMSLEEARRQAAIKFGSSPATLESCRDERRGLSGLRPRDRHSLCIPAVSAVAGLCGGLRAVPRVRNRGQHRDLQPRQCVLLRPVAFPEPDRLVAVFSVNPAPGAAVYGAWRLPTIATGASSPAHLKTWRRTAVANCSSGLTIEWSRCRGRASPRVFSKCFDVSADARPRIRA